MANHPSTRVLLPTDPAWNRSRKFFLRNTRDTDVAADLLQELHLKHHVWQRGGNRSIENFDGFIATVAHSVLMSWWRTTLRHDVVSMPNDELPEPYDAPTPRDPAQILERERWRADFRAELDRYSTGAKTRAILENPHVNNAELAERLDTTAASIRTCRSKFAQWVRKDPERRRRFEQLLRTAPGW